MMWTRAQSLFTQLRFVLLYRSVLKKSFKIIEKLDPYIKGMKHQENSSYYNSYQKWIGGNTDQGYKGVVKLTLIVLIIPLLVVVIVFFPHACRDKEEDQRASTKES